MSVLEINGARAKSLRVIVPKSGPWLAIAEIDGVADVAEGAAEVVAGAVTLTGAIMPEASGTFLTSSHVHVIGGVGGWRKRIAARSYHNDAGISVGYVLSSTAAAIGEPLGELPATRLPAVDWQRIEGPARDVIDRLVPGWYVDFAGVTQMLARVPGTPAAGVELKAFKPLLGMAEYGVDQLTDLAIGMTVSDKLPRSMTVEGLEFVFSGETKVFAWLV